MKRRNNRKTIIICILTGVLSAGIGITSSILLFNMESRINGFTVGDVGIDFQEEKWEQLSTDEKIAYPGKTITKDPKITNTGTNDLYAYIEIKIPRAKIRTVNDDETVNDAAWHDLFTYTINEGWEEIQSSISEDNTYTIKVYGYTRAILSKGESTSTLFDGVTYINALEGEIKMGETVKMPVSAQAIQSGELGETGSNIKEKMTDAYLKYKEEAEKRL